MKSTPEVVECVIRPPALEVAQFKIVGTAPLVTNKFSAKAKHAMQRAQEEGSTAKKRKQREAKDFDECFRGALYTSPDGWHGISAAAFRNASISACRVAGFTMTRAKLSIFTLPDGFDAEDSTPLVRITKGKPERWDSLVRLQGSTTDIHPRPKWRPGWEAVVTMRYDRGQFTVIDVGNLLAIVGQQVGIGEGRPDSKASAGMGFGLFDIIPD